MIALITTSTITQVGTLVLTCPSVSDTKLMGIRDSGSVAWPASSRNTWVKWPTLKKKKKQFANSELKFKWEIQKLKPFFSPGLTGFRHYETWQHWNRCWPQSCGKQLGECLLQPSSKTAALLEYTKEEQIDSLIQDKRSKHWNNCSWHLLRRCMHTYSLLIYLYNIWIQMLSTSFPLQDALTRARLVAWRKPL